MIKFEVISLIFDDGGLGQLKSRLLHEENSLSILFLVTVLNLGANICSTI